MLYKNLFVTGKKYINLLSRTGVLTLRFSCILLVMAWMLYAPMALHADVTADSDTVGEWLQVLENDPNDKTALKAVAFYYLNIGEYGRAREYGRRLLNIGESSGDRDFCELYGRIILAASQLDKDPQECFRQLENARVIAETTGNHDALLSINNSTGMYYLLVHNDAYTALTYYYKALEDAKAIDDVRRYGIVLSNLSGAYMIMKDASGLTLAEQAHDIALKRGETVPLYYAKHALADFCLLTDSLDRAERLINEAEELYRNGGLTGNPGLYILRGELAEKRGNFKEAYSNYARAMENFGESDPSLISATYLAYARLLRKDRHTPSAINVLEYRLKTIDPALMTVHTPELIKELVYSYRDAGDYRKALDRALEYQVYQDSIFKLGRERALQENRIRHEVFLNERKIDEQNIELMAARHRQTLLVAGGIAVLLLLALTYFNYRKKDRLYRAIVAQNSEYLVREQALLEQIEHPADNRPAQQHEVAAGSTSLHSDKAADLMARFTRLMLEHKIFADSSLTLSDVAERLGTNRTYLSKAINETTGKTFTQVVNEYRIREAVALISDPGSNRPLKQICADVGFNTISTFYSSFQNSTGMTPAAYRSRVRNM